MDAPLNAGAIMETGRHLVGFSHASDVSDVTFHVRRAGLEIRRDLENPLGFAVHHEHAPRS